MASEHLLTVSREGAVAILTIDDPATRNAISARLINDLVAACAALNPGVTVGCAILTGAGDVFCAGGNIKDMSARANHFAGNAAEIRRTYLHGVQAGAPALYDLEIPVIAAVNGPAMGGGFDLAMMCKIRNASEIARFAESFIKPGLGSAAARSWVLTRRIGSSCAAP